MQNNYLNKYSKCALDNYITCVKEITSSDITRDEEKDLGTLWQGIGTIPKTTLTNTVVFEHGPRFF